MRILMLGWEFPPFIAGGLGVACYGLTRALDRLGHGVLFMLPRPVEKGTAPAPTTGTEPARAAGPTVSTGAPRVESPVGGKAAAFRHVRFRAVPSTVTSPYPGGEPGGGGPAQAEEAAFSPSSAALGRLAAEGNFAAIAELERSGGPGTTGIAMVPVQRAGGTYSGDLMGDTDRYARLVVSLARTEPFDVIH